MTYRLTGSISGVQLVALALLAALLAGWGWMGCSNGSAPRETPVAKDSQAIKQEAEPVKTATSTHATKPMQAVTIAGETFDLELALTPEARHQGLSDRAEIPDQGGMLFVFPEAQRTAFVMRKCLVPIDVLFVDEHGQIVAVHAMETEPYHTPEWALTRYESGQAVQFAIELQGGTIERLELAPGQTVELPTEALKSQAR